MSGAGNPGPDGAVTKLQWRDINSGNNLLMTKAERASLNNLGEFNSFLQKQFINSALFVQTTTSYNQGEVIEIDGVKYDVVTEDASDYDFQNSATIPSRVKKRTNSLNNAISRVVDVRDFNISLTGASDDTSEVQKAIDQASAAGGGMLFHPGGTILCSGLVGKLGVGFSGIGPSSVFKRPVTGSSGFICTWSDDECYDVVVENAAFDLQTQTDLSGNDLLKGGAGDFKQGIRIRDLRTTLTDQERIDKDNRILIHNNYFFNSNKDNNIGNWTLIGCLVQGCNQVSVCNNMTSGVQIQVSGSSYGGHRISCQHNLCRDVNAYAISAVVSAPSSGTRYLSDVNISNNQIYGQGTRAPAIYAGLDDGDSGGVESENITIANNVIRAYNSTSNPNFSHIFFRPGDDGAKNVLIHANICYMETDANAPAFKTAIQAADATISDNKVYGDLTEYAIRAEGNSQVLNNTIVGDTRGIALFGGYFAKGNFISSGGVSGATPRIYVNPDTDQTVYMEVSGNTIYDNQSGASDFSKQPISVRLDGGCTLNGVISDNNVIDIGNTTQSLDFNDADGTFGTIVIARNHFGPATLYKRALSNAILSGNTGASTTQNKGSKHYSAEFEAPPVLPEYTVATLPSTSSYDGGVILVSDETGGQTIAFSDGTNWRRVQDRAVVS